jgi:hypothetical protein
VAVNSLASPLNDRMSLFWISRPGHPGPFRLTRYRSPFCKGLTLWKHTILTQVAPYGRILNLAGARLKGRRMISIAFRDSGLKRETETFIPVPLSQKTAAIG